MKKITVALLSLLIISSAAFAQDKKTQETPKKDEKPKTETAKTEKPVKTQDTKPTQTKMVENGETPIQALEKHGKVR